MNVITRLKSGVNLQQAQAQMDTVNQRLAQNYRETNTGWGVHLTTLQERWWGDASVVAASARRGSFCVADRVCECRESVTGSRDRPAKRNCGANCARRQPLANRPAIAN